VSAKEEEKALRGDNVKNCARDRQREIPRSTNRQKRGTRGKDVCSIKRARPKGRERCRRKSREGEREAATSTGEKKRNQRREKRKKLQQGWRKEIPSVEKHKSDFVRGVGEEGGTHMQRRKGNSSKGKVTILGNNNPVGSGEVPPPLSKKGPSYSPQGKGKSPLKD